MLSFLFNGLGQIYNGQIKKGLIIISISILNMLVFIFGSTIVILWFMGRSIFPEALILGIVLFILGVISIGILGVYSIYDAYNFSRKK